MKNVVRYSLAATIIAVGMVLSSICISKFFVRVKHEKEIRVSGSAKARIVSDIGKCSLELNVEGKQRAETYRELTKQIGEVIARVRPSAPEDLAIELGNPDISEWRRDNYDERGHRIDDIVSFKGSQSIRMTSSDLQWVKRVSQGLNALLGEGYNLDVNSPQFFVSDLTAIKQKLLLEATDDGYSRAVLMAKHSKAEVGMLRAARQGVFQITVPNSTETSWGGMYDKSTIEKSIKAVVTLEYAIE